MKKLFLSTLLLALPMLVSAYNAKIGGIYYDLNTPNKRAIVTYLRYEANNSTHYFSDYTGSVDIPEKVKYNGVTYSVTGIGQYAFVNCSSLTSVTIPNSVTSIGNGAFNGCTSLTSVTIPNSVTSIEKNAFYECSGLNSVIIGYSVTNIGDDAFFGCTSLASLSIPNSVTSIGNGAFSYCRCLTSITIPASVNSIGFGILSGCTGLASIIVEDGNTIYDSRDNCNAIIETNSNQLIAGCTNTTIPNSVTSIGNNAFRFCTGLTSVTIPNSVTSIGNGAFFGCTGLTSVTIPSSVTSIGNGAFQNCTGMVSLTIPNSVTSIENYAFSACYKLEIVYCYAEQVPNTGQVAFDYFIQKNATLYVPYESLVGYNSTEPWSHFGKIKPFGGFDYLLRYFVDGNLYLTYTIKEGVLITPEPYPTKEGYTFSGWSEIPTIMPDYDVDIIGTFTINKYKLTYTLDNKEYKTTEVDYGTTIIPEETPFKEGYTFSGWSEIPTTMPASDVTISGIFTPNKYKLTYTVDGVEYKTVEVDCGAAITPEDNPTKEGYTFSGWSEIPETMPAGDVTVTGTFTINTYTITYMVDNALLMTEEVTYGSTITPPASPKEGYEITWNSHPTTMPAYDVTIYGSYISTDINGIYAEESDKKVYTPDGKRVQSPKKGLNIIRMSDGTIKKVVVK